MIDIGKKQKPHWDSKISGKGFENKLFIYVRLVVGGNLFEEDQIVHDIRNGQDKNDGKKPFVKE
jgi:hypothetical protein